MYDLRHALRTLAKHPGFVAITTLVLALGIGLNTAIFSIVRAVLFTTLPVPASHELVSIYQVSPRQPDRATVIFNRQYEFLNQHNDVFTGLTAHWGLPLSVRADNETDVVNAAWVLSNYFNVLGAAPAIGRTLLAAEDDVANPARAVVVSHSLWTRRFKSDPDIVGRTIEIGFFGQAYMPYTVVGVMGPEFRGVSEPWKPVHLWTTFAQGQDTPSVDWGGVAIGRLRPGVAVEQGRAVVEALGRQEYYGRPRPDPQYEPRLVTLPTDSVRTPFDPSAAIVPRRLAAALTIVVAMVLLVAAANIAGLLLARGVGRAGEIAIRRALGAAPPAHRPAAVDRKPVDLRDRRRGRVVARAPAHPCLSRTHAGAVRAPSLHENESRGTAAARVRPPGETTRASLTQPVRRMPWRENGGDPMPPSGSVPALIPHQCCPHPCGLSLGSAASL